MKTHMGFTLVELMIVVGTIGLLAAMAIPNMVRAREHSQNSRFAADLNVACDAFVQYSFDSGRYPPDRMPGQMPAGMESYLARVAWTQPTTMGGKWDWDYRQFGCIAGVSVYQPDRPMSQLAAVDELIDDGNLVTGSFRSRASGYIRIIE